MVVLKFEILIGCLRKCCCGGLVWIGCVGWGWVYLVRFVVGSVVF